MATTFPVTSNADSGPGTLRDALTQAAANGSATPDLISFNFADQSQAGRTITLASALPAVSSNLTIDGTTQAGTPFGISGARVVITNPFSLSLVSYFEMIGVSNVQIYGLFLLGASTGYAFHFREAHNLSFGAPGKGNLLNGFAQVFNCDYISSTEPGSSDITIQGNIMGTDPTGTLITAGTLNGIDFYFDEVANLQIGGLNPGEGNLMVEQDYPMNYTCVQNTDFGFLNIEGNTQGTDVTGNIRLCQGYTSWEINGYNTGSASVTGTTPVNIKIINNTTVGGFGFFAIASPFTIQGNHLGVGSNGSSNLITGATGGENFMLDFEFCTGGLIGGPDPRDKNWVANNGYGVFEFWCSNITISRNSFFCNNIGITMNWLVPGRPQPFVNISLLTAGQVGGTALPGSTIELFYDDECPGCEGKTYIGSTTADANGNWTYALTATGAIVATATDTYGATSMFSTATINADNIIVKNATCGRKNGSISNILVTSGTEWYWQDANGNIVGNSTNLTSVGPGTYTFVTSIGGATCAASSTPYTITDVEPPAVNINDITVTQPSCGQALGAFQYAGAFDPTAAYSWLKGGNVVCADYTVANPLGDLAPGSYLLQVALKQDANCFAQYGPILLVNQSGPSLDMDNLQITPSTCSKNNGSITNASYQTTTGSVYVAWEDGSGVVVSNSLDLVNFPPGPYRLLLKDGGPCDTITTTRYTIPDNGTISYDTSQLVVTPATCAATNGAISGVTATNAVSYSWNDLTTGVPAGNTADLTALAPGSYQLDLTNTYGCQAVLPVFVVPQVPPPAFDYSALKVLNDTCNSGQGAILDLRMADTSRAYTWNWFSLASGSGSGSQPEGSSAGQLTGLHAGSYGVTVTDQYACSANSEPFTIHDIELSPPAPQVSDQYIPRNTTTLITVGNPQTGTYELLDGPAPGAAVLSTSTTGNLETPLVPGDETLYVGFTRGDCSSVLSPVNIKVFDSVKLFVPNAFTPNTAANNRWRIIAQGRVNSIRIAVFDRWGAEVFAATSIDDSWDGTSGGRALSGVFAYTIFGKDYYNRPFRLTGTVLVIR